MLNQPPPVADIKTCTDRHRQLIPLNPREDSAGSDSIRAVGLLIDPGLIESGLNVDAGLLRVAAAQSEGQDTRQTTIAVETTANVATAHGLRHQWWRASSNQNSRAEHRLLDASSVGQSVAGEAVDDGRTDHPLLHVQDIGEVAGRTPAREGAVDILGENSFLQQSLLDRVVGQIDGIGQSQDGQVVVVGDRVELVMGEDVRHSADFAARIDDEETVVSTGDAQQGGIDHGRAGGIDHTVGCGQDVATVQQHSLAVQVQRCVQRAVGGEFSDKGVSASHDIGGPLTTVLLAENGCK